MQSTPKALRLHVGIFGRRNVGKSSLLNAITRQNVSIVSAIAGTTTDPVEKPMEFLPLGPVLFVDTAGIDDEGALGELRMQKTRAILDRVDLGIIVTAAGEWGPFEAGLIAELDKRRVPAIVAVNKVDLQPLTDEEYDRLSASGADVVGISATTSSGMAALRDILLRVAPADLFDSRRLICDLVPAGEVAVLVIPIDKEAPKGRIILPQVMAIRDLLDGGSLALVTQERELAGALAGLAKPPALVGTGPGSALGRSRLTS
jgi:[FeFe] hydrogenase H-cluster maturation GTPase HydF